MIAPKCIDCVHAVPMVIHGPMGGRLYLNTLCRKTDVTGYKHDMLPCSAARLSPCGPEGKLFEPKPPEPPPPPKKPGFFARLFGGAK